MELRELGEFGWIAGIREKFRGVPSGESLGIGDDCAVIPCGDGEALVVTTDMLIEDVHFLRAVIPPYLLGRKSLAVNLSDVASMGAVPIASFLSIALPGDVSAGWADRFTDGYRSLSEEFGVPLLGGDTTSSQDRIAINVTAIGRIARAKVKYRSGARENDIVYVTGYLGDSAQGLLDIRSGVYDSPFVAVHHDPHPCVNEGIWLGNQPEVHAMMDISDGLASDLSHILEESKTGAEISIERIPTRTTVELAVTGGEDYQLLLTVGAEAADRIAAEYVRHFGKPLYGIGRIRSGSPDIIWSNNGEGVRPQWKGFRHF